MNNDLSFREFMNSFNKKNVGTKSELEVYLDALKGFSVADFQDGSLKVIKNKLLSLISDNKELMSRKKVMLAVCGLIISVGGVCGYIFFADIILKLLAIAMVSGLGLLSIVKPLVKSLKNSKKNEKNALLVVSRTEDILELRERSRSAIDVNYHEVVDKTDVSEKKDFRSLLKLIFLNLGKLPDEIARSYNLKLNMIYIKYGNSFQNNKTCAFVELQNLADEIIEAIMSLGDTSSTKTYARQRVYNEGSY